MHSAGLELTKLTYTRLEDNLIRHRGDRSISSLACWCCIILFFARVPIVVAVFYFIFWHGLLIDTLLSLQRASDI